ncbi:hypothetical protein GCM10011386_35360 [Parapedobacter defluvii]|uniref:FecR family protein n=1 Tax=Parapedobacter defluvii TaxID=2045106 RepID=A0ABQ1MJV6_9SPHI|nr:FecR family protein [Parapedobacter defluvii]GGC40231.1 hypothetical protein GCM10011386_35360 [Parapedobacter defluvii]
MTKKDIQQLIDRYHQGLASPQEVAQIESWYLQHANESPAIDHPKDLMDRMNRGLPPILATPQLRQEHRPRFLRLQVRYAAAIAILALMFGTWFFLIRTEQPQERAIAAEAILPGGNRATLTLADGRTVELSKSQNGIIVGDEVTYYDGSPIIKTNKTLALQRDVLNSIRTPKGGTYQLTLPDGSNVWLNAASTLRYPSNFSGDERVVEISGEAYFSIVKDEQKPFKVISKGQEIKVLGTEFNLSSYPEEEIKTTLVSGKVRVTPSGVSAVEMQGSGSRKSDGSVVLSPGQQSVTRENISEVRDVETEPYTAWKDGFFYFDNMTPRAAIELIARWYDLEVVYEGIIPNQAIIFGVVDRKKPLSSVLKSLGKSGLAFEVRGADSVRRLFVTAEK